MAPRADFDGPGYIDHLSLKGSIALTVALPLLIIFILTGGYFCYRHRRKQRRLAAARATLIADRRKSQQSESGTTKNRGEGDDVEMGDVFVLGGGKGRNGSVGGVSGRSGNGKEPAVVGERREGLLVPEGSQSRRTSVVGTVVMGNSGPITVGAVAAGATAMPPPLYTSNSFHAPGSSGRQRSMDRQRSRDGPRSRDGRSRDGQRSMERQRSDDDLTIMGDGASPEPPMPPMPQRAGEPSSMMPQQTAMGNARAGA